MFYAHARFLQFGCFANVATELGSQWRCRKAPVRTGFKVRNTDKKIAPHRIQDKYVAYLVRIGHHMGGYCHKRGDAYDGDKSPQAAKNNSVPLHLQLYIPKLDL